MSRSDPPGQRAERGRIWRESVRAFSIPFPDSVTRNDRELAGGGGWCSPGKAGVVVAGVSRGNHATSATSFGGYSIVGSPRRGEVECWGEVKWR